MKSVRMRKAGVALACLSLTFVAGAGDPNDLAKAQADE
jgi:hypothetical protein